MSCPVPLPALMQTVWTIVIIHGSTLSPSDLRTNSKCLNMAPGTKQLSCLSKKDMQNFEDVNVNVNANRQLSKRIMKRNISCDPWQDRADAAFCCRLMLRCGVEGALVPGLLAEGGSGMRETYASTHDCGIAVVPMSAAGPQRMKWWRSAFTGWIC
jgi:hypothetical protein